jgi:hypothetical protein
MRILVETIMWQPTVIRTQGSATQNEPGDWGFWIISAPAWQLSLWTTENRLNLNCHSE